MCVLPSMHSPAWFAASLPGGLRYFVPFALCSQGVWAPSLNISTVLAGVRQLLKEPNPDDPLMVDIVGFGSHDGSRQPLITSPMAYGLT